MANDTTTKDDGRQNLIVNGITVPLAFKDKKNLISNLQRSDEEELMDLDIH